MSRCNLFETGSASEWTLYISEWTPAPGAGGLPLSNIRITTKVSFTEKKVFLCFVFVMKYFEMASKYPFACS